MKKLFLILITVLGLSAIGNAQKTYVQGGVGVESKKFTQTFELGVAKGANQFGVVGETFKTGNNTPSENRQYFAGVKYARNFKSGLQASGAVKIHLNANTYDVVFEPGVAYNLKLSPSVQVQPSISTPIYEGSSLFRPVNLSAGVAVQIKL